MFVVRRFRTRELQPLIMVCKSAEDAAAVRRMLEKKPPNDKARFFNYSISREGLVVTVC